MQRLVFLTNKVRKRFAVKLIKALRQQPEFAKTVLRFKELLKEPDAFKFSLNLLLDAPFKIIPEEN